MSQCWQCGQAIQPGQLERREVRVTEGKHRGVGIDSRLDPVVFLGSTAYLSRVDMCRKCATELDESEASESRANANFVNYLGMVGFGFLALFTIAIVFAFFVAIFTRGR